MKIRVNFFKGFAESYMLGEVSSPDLTKSFEVSANDIDLATRS